MSCVGVGKTAITATVESITTLGPAGATCAYLVIRAGTSTGATVAMIILQIDALTITASKSLVADKHACSRLTNEIRFALAAG